MREEKATTPDTTDTTPTTKDEEVALKKRFAKSAAIARTLQRELHKGAYYWNKNITAILPELYVMTLLIENDRLKRPPLTPTQIEETEKIPRRSATRYLNQLVKHGLAVRKVKGYATSPAFWRATLNAPYIRRSTAVFKSGAHVLRKLTK